MEHLLSYGIERLEQTGRTHIVDGEKVKARKKTNNKWFETQDSISYWEDFYKPKVVWTAVNAEYKFCYIPEGVMLNNALFMVTGAHIQTLLAVFNSKVFKFYLKLLFGESYQYGAKDSFDKIPVLQVPDEVNAKFDKLVHDIQREYTIQKAQEIDSILFDLYHLTTEERKTINIL